MVIGSKYHLPYFDFGEGERNFILIPGSSMTSILDSESGVKSLFAPYTKDFHIYVFDVPEELDSVKDIKQFADIIADAAADLGINSADVYGASMGGMVAQEIAIRHRNLVRSLTLASTMSRNNDVSNKVFSEWVETSDSKKLAEVINKHVYSNEYYSTYSDIFHTLESKADALGVKRMNKLARMMLDFSAYDDLYKIKCPVYLFAGGNDNVLSVKGSTEIAEKLNCSIKVYNGYSHAVYDELPGFYDEVFNNLRQL